MRYAFDSFRRRPGRAFATAGGIGLATAMVVLLLALSAGIQASSTRLAGASGVDLLAASANTSISGGTFPPVAGAHALARSIPRQDPNVVSASPWLVSALVYGNASLYAAANSSTGGQGIPGGWAPTGSGAVGWIPGDNVGLETPAIRSGPGFSSSGDPHFGNGTYQGPATHQVVLDGGLATVLHVVPGQLVWAARTSVPSAAGVSAWYANATPFRVVGISAPFWLVPSALLSFLYLSELQGLVGGATPGTDYASLVLIHLADPSRASADQGRIETAFPALTVFTLGNVLGAVQNIVDLYRTFGDLVGVVAILVAVLFTTTVLLMSVDDRSREIAVFRAVGFSRRTIGRWIVEEALLLSLVGLAIGLPLGAAGALAINAALGGLVSGLPNGFSFISLDPIVLANALITVLAVGLMAACAPVVRAFTLPIAEELRAP